MIDKNVQMFYHINFGVAGYDYLSYSCLKMFPLECVIYLDTDALLIHSSLPYSYWFITNYVHY